MAAIPTLEEEDAKRPTRERESLVGERTRIVNRIKVALARLGVRGFKPTLRKALEHLDALRTPEGTVLPPNTRARPSKSAAVAVEPHDGLPAGAGGITAGGHPVCPQPPPQGSRPRL